MFGFISDLIGDIAGDFYGNLPPEILAPFQPGYFPDIDVPDVSFKPFTVTDAFGGSIGTDEFGGVQYNMSEQQKALQDMLSGGATDFFNQAQMDPAMREQAVFDRMMSTMAPSQERERMDLESRLAAQGRLGVQTNQFGGTPEALTLAKAQEEARNSAMLGAMSQAQREQAQQAALGQQFMQQSYAPMQAMLSQFSPALNVASMADVARRQGGQNSLQAQLAMLDAMAGQGTGLSSLYSNMFSGAMNLAGGIGSGLAGVLEDTGYFGLF
jgi:hypothetical protein